jgi:sec-independent protein translocase protein TatB
MEVLIVAVIALVVFGPHRLPEMARTVGKFVAEFRRQANELSNEFKLGLDDDDEEPPGEERFDHDLRYDGDEEEDEPVDGDESTDGERADRQLAVESEEDPIAGESEEEDDDRVEEVAGPSEGREAAPGPDDSPAAADLNGRRTPQAAPRLAGARDTADEDPAGGHP